MLKLGSLFFKNRNFKYLLSGIDIFTKYALVEPLKYIKYKTVLKYKRNELWVDQGRKFYNKLMQEWLDNNNVLIFFTHHEAKSVINGRFIKKIKAKIYTEMTANDTKSYIIYFNKVDQYNNSCHHSKKNWQKTD